MASRKKVWRMIVGSPFFYAFAIAAGFISVFIPIVIYSIAPIIFMFLPQMEFDSGIFENEKHVD
jgi:fatty acid desaturase